MESLSEEIVEKLNTKFGVKGQRHSRDDFTETPCFEWPLIDNNNFLFGWDEYLIAKLYEVRDLLKGDPVFAYFSVISSNFGGGPGFVVAPVVDQFDILRIEETGGNNVWLDTDDIIEKLRFFDQEFGVDILSANGSGVLFKVVRSPQGQAAEELMDWVERFWAMEYERPDDLHRVALWWD